MENSKSLIWMTRAGVSVALLVCVMVALRHLAPPKEVAVAVVKEPNMVKLTSSFSGSRYRDYPLPVFELAINPPKMLERVMVYKLVQPGAMTESDARRLSHEYFDMPLDAELTRSRSSNYIHLKTDTHLFELDVRRGWLDNMKLEHVRAKPSRRREDYPSDEACRKIAESYLRQRNLLPDDAGFTRVVDNSSAGYMTVRWTQIIGGYACIGPDGAMIVRIGVGGEIVSVSKQWMKVEPFREYPIKTALEAFEEVKSGKGWFLRNTGGTINKIEIWYHCDTSGYVEPLYCFDYSTSERFQYVVVPAIRQEYLKPSDEMMDATQRKSEGVGEPSGDTKPED